MTILLSLLSFGRFRLAMEVFLWGERCIGIFLLEFFVVVGGLFGWVVFVCWGIFLCKCMILSPWPGPCLTQQSCQIRFQNFQQSIRNLNVSHHTLVQNSTQC